MKNEAGDPTAATSRFGSIFIGMLFGLAIAAIGLLFCWLLFRGYLKAKETRNWTAVEALIVKSEVLEVEAHPGVGISFAHDFEYQYEYGGVIRTAENIKRQLREKTYQGGGHQSKTEKLVKEYPIGRTLPCYVNPNAPDDVVLEHSTLAPLYTMWFPGLFVIGGIGIAASTLFRGLSKANSSQE